VGWPLGGSCGFPGAKIAGSCYSQWNELKLADIGHQRTLFLSLYSDLSPRGWLCCGMGQRGRCGFPGAKMAGRFYSQWNELTLADIGHQRTLFLSLYSDLSPRGWLRLRCSPRPHLPQMANAAYTSLLLPRPLPTIMRQHSTPHGRQFKPMYVTRNHDLVEL
jgi:hypothetical protein